MDDVLVYHSHLTTDQAMEILQAIEFEHDASVGVNWDVINAKAYELFKSEPEVIEEEEEEDDPSDE